jgi:hypothetical protein
MRKVSASDVKWQFLVQIDGMLSYIGRVSTALSGSSTEKRDISHLCESVFLDGYVAFEWFISDLFLAYMNHDFTYYQNDLSQ